MTTTVRRCLGLILVAYASCLPAWAGADWPLPATTPAAAGFSSERLERLHGNLRRTVEAGNYSGYVLLLARDGKVADWRAHGWHDVAAATPMQRDSIVKIYSMSKIITSAALMMLVEDGLVRLGDPVEKFLPALRDRQVFAGGTADQPELVKAQRAITVRDLLTHTAGYYYEESYSSDAPLGELFRRQGIWEASNLEDFVSRVAKLPLHEQPGTRFRYGISTDLLGAIIEKASGETLDRFLARRIFEPLQLRDTGFWVPEAKQSRLALVHTRGEAGKVSAGATGNESVASPEGGLLSGGGGLYSTAADYARFAQMLLNGGELDGVRLLSRKTLELMTQNHLEGLEVPHPFGIPSQGFGLGVRVVTHLGASTLLGSPGTFGWDGAATTFVLMDPRERLVAILLLQHFPFNQDDVFATFTNGIYSALAD